MTPIELKLDAVSVHIRDVERARHFYGQILGLRELQRLPAGLVYALPGSATVLSAHIMQPNEVGRPPGTVTGVVFGVADARAALEAIRAAGGTITDEAVDVTNPSGSYVRGTIADPDGNEFLVRQRVSP